MNRTLFLALLLVSVGVFLGPSYVSADVVASASTTPVWNTSLSTGYVVSLSYSLCSSTGVNTISGIVKGLPSNLVITDANLFASIRKPDNTTTDVNFVNNLSGTYTEAFNFDQNGTYFIQAHAYNGAIGAKGDKNAYVYVGDLNWVVAFLNNGFSLGIGELGTIRNTVTNSDGNLVYDVNASTTIFYPDGTIADANQTMSQTSDGEYAKSFFGPSPAGLYSVGSIFKCGSKYAYSAGGTFTVTEAASSGGGGGGGGGSGGSTGAGGSYGGGGGGVKKAQIVSFDFDPPLSKNASSVFSITVQNFTAQIADYLAVYTVTSPTGEEETGEKLISSVAAMQSTTVVVDPSITPLYNGVYSVNVKLKTVNSIGTYDAKTQDYDVQGAHNLTFTISPTSDSTAAGLSYPFTLALYNGGDFPENAVAIDWHLIDPQGNEYFNSSFTSSVQVQGTQTYSFSPFIPLNSKLGPHELVINVTSSGVKQTKTVMFDVLTPNDYYTQFVTDLEVRIDQLQDKVNQLKSKGFDVSEAALDLLDIQQQLARAKGMLLAGNFKGLNTELLSLSEKITREGALLDGLEQQSPLLSREGLTLMLVVGGGVIATAFFWIMFQGGAGFGGSGLGGVAGGSAAAPLPKIPMGDDMLSHLLFTRKPYYPLEQRKGFKRKPLISDLLGLKEEK